MASNIFAMPASSVALLFFLSLGVTNAVPWGGAHKTAIYQIDAFSPKPTGAPSLELFKRVDTYIGVSVCGWLGGDEKKVAGCDAGSSCIHDTKHGYIGCCATAGPCTDGVYTTCLDNKSTGWDSTQGMINNGVLTWYV